MQGNWEKEKFHAQPHKNPKVIYDVNGNRSSSQNHCEVKAIVTMQIKVLKEAKEDKKNMKLTKKKMCLITLFLPIK